MAVAAVFLLAFTAYFSSCKTDDLSVYNPILTAEDEKDLGDELFRTVINNPSQFDILPPEQYPEVYDYLNLAWWMVKNTTNIRDNFNWDVFVVHNDNVLQAYTFPGGKFGISTGLLKQLGKENQLLSIMAHEAYYNDRINQNAVDALSPVMDKLKLMVSANDGVGTKVFKDVINGISDKNMDMVGYCMNLSYEPRTVFTADDYAMNMILCPYTYSPMGLKEIILMAEQENITGFEWLNNRPPSVAIDDNSNYSLALRKAHLQSLEAVLLSSSECSNSEESLDSDTYLEMMEKLP